ncbi:hypothetical protein P3342_004736 [Pyrenophora teres f. teres]|nr:hypothetical protein P3342_004736 [Pyrenophora teres f. teres]
MLKPQLSIAERRGHGPLTYTIHLSARWIRSRSSLHDQIHAQLARDAAGGSKQDARGVGTWRGGQDAAGVGLRATAPR